MRARLTVVGESCPVCGSEATRGQATSDVVQIRCPRCGPFTITGTALAMLASRLDGNERSRARASYAIRSVTSEEHWLELYFAGTVALSLITKLVDQFSNGPLPPAGPWPGSITASMSPQRYPSSSHPRLPPRFNYRHVGESRS